MKILNIEKKSGLTFCFGALALIVGLTGTASAQSDALRKLYETSAIIPTNLVGISAYTTPPEGFDAVNASDEELAAYGIPRRPDEVADARAYERWTRVAQMMSNPRTRWNGELKPRPVHGRLGSSTQSASGKPEITFGTTAVSGKGWSGVVNTVPGTKWSSATSFSWISAEFPVPWPQQAFNGSGGNICDGDTDQVSTWVGLGGLSVAGVNLGKQDNIAQAGVDGYFYCGFGTSQGLYAWVEWFPGPTAALFDVAGGDDIYVYVESTSATKALFAIEDFTRQENASYLITAPSGFKLVGNEAEFIVERPGGDSQTPNGLYPLANYVWSILDFCKDRTLSGQEYGPGEVSAATYVVSMTDDSGNHLISVPTTDKGLEQLSVMDQNCARLGGCAP